MAKDSIGLESIPPEATRGGGLNDSPSADERSEKARTKLGDGPRKGPAGEFLPATYKTLAVVTQDPQGNRRTVKPRIREDR